MSTNYIRSLQEKLSIIKNMVSSGRLSPAEERDMIAALTAETERAVGSFAQTTPVPTYISDPAYTGGSVPASQSVIINYYGGDWASPIRVDPAKLLLQRLRLSHLSKDRVTSVGVQKGASKVFVVVVRGDEHTVLEDDISLYPSDTLVTAFRLLLN